MDGKEAFVSYRGLYYKNFHNKYCAVCALEAALESTSLQCFVNSLFIFEGVPFLSETKIDFIYNPSSHHGLQLPGDVYSTGPDDVLTTKVINDVITRPSLTTMSTNDVTTSDDFETKN